MITRLLEEQRRWHLDRRDAAQRFGELGAAHGVAKPRERGTCAHHTVTAEASSRRCPQGGPPPPEGRAGRSRRRGQREARQRCARGWGTLSDGGAVRADARRDGPGAHAAQRPPSRPASRSEAAGDPPVDSQRGRGRRRRSRRRGAGSVLARTSTSRAALVASCASLLTAISTSFSSSFHVSPGRIFSANASSSAGNSRSLTAFTLASKIAGLFESDASRTWGRASFRDDDNAADAIAIRSGRVAWRRSATDDGATRRIVPSRVVVAISAERKKEKRSTAPTCARAEWRVAAATTAAAAARVTC